MAVGLMPSTLLFVAAADAGERFDQQFPAHQVISVPDLSHVESYCHDSTTAAVIAPLSERSGRAIH